MSECPFCRKPFIDCECKGRCVHCNQSAGAEGRANYLLSMVMSGRLVKPGKKLSAALADANEWKQQHENLLAVRQQDLAALNARIEQLESQLANARKADSELADRFEKLLEKAPPRPWFKTDDKCYLHFSHMGRMPTGETHPGEFPVVGRFDYGPGAMEFVEFIGNNAPAIIAALRKL